MIPTTMKKWIYSEVILKAKKPKIHEITKMMPIIKKTLFILI